MSIRAIVTLGYGAFGTIADIVRMGYESAIAAPAVAPHYALKIAAQDRISVPLFESRYVKIADEGRRVDA